MISHRHRTGILVTLCLPVLLGVICRPRAAYSQDEQAVLRLEEEWTNVFGGNELVFHAVAASVASPRVRMLVEPSLEHRVLARNEYLISVGVDGSPDVKRAKDWLATLK